MNRERLSRVDHHRFKDRQDTKRALALAGSLLLVGCDQSADMPERPIGTSATKVPYDTFADMIILRVDNPTDTLPARSNAPELAATFKDTLRRISRSVDDALQVPSNIPVLETSLEPASLVTPEGVITCYDEQILYEARDTVLRQNGIPVSTLTSIILESDSGVCNVSQQNTAAYVKNDGKANGGIFVRDQLELAGDARGALIAHEFGHTDGLNLSHVGSVMSGGVDNPLHQAGHRDIKELVSGDYQFRSGSDHDKDMYAGTSSVMGSVARGNMQHEVYNFAQINKLNPNAAHIEVIDTKKGASYLLNMNKDSLRGIAIDLPEGHPISQMKGGEKIQRLYIGLNGINGDDYSDIQIIAAEASDGNGHDPAMYDLNITSFIPSEDYEYDEVNFGRTEIYHDETIGIRIFAEATANAVLRKNSEVKLIVETIE